MGVWLDLHSLCLTISPELMEDFANPESVERKFDPEKAKAVEMSRNLNSMRNNSAVAK